MKVIKNIMIMAALMCAVIAQANEADSAYLRDEFSRAAQMYEDLLKHHGPNADVYYNLGNANFRRGHLAQAVINYERALKVDPTHADARLNLKFVNSRLEDRPDDNNSLLTRLHQSVIMAQTANMWAWTALILFILTCGAVALYFFGSNVTIRKVGFFSGVCLGALTLYGVIVAAGAASRVNDHSEGIVTTPVTLMNSVPRQPRQTEKVVPIHEGTKLQILDSVATPDDPVSPRWYKVRLGGSAPAWVRATDVELL